MIKTTTHQYGLMSTLMGPQMQQSERSGIYICFSSGKTPSRALAAGALSSNYRADLTSLHETARLLSAETPPLPHIVFLRDCRSAVQRLQSPRKRHTASFFVTCHNTARSLSSGSLLSVGSQETRSELGRLAKSGSEQEQPNLEISYGEAKVLIKQLFSQSTI